MSLLLLLESNVLKTFVNSTDDSGWEDTALNWLIVAIVVSAVCAIGMLLVKWLKKQQARNIIQKTWSASETVALMLIGLGPVLLGLLVAWYMTRNFFNYVSVSGLFKGIVISWISYLLFMSVSHLLSPWRRDLF